MARYQHLVPQREQDHEVRPKKKKDSLGWHVCVECGERIRIVADNEGPEGLKALLRF